MRLKRAIFLTVIVFASAVWGQRERIAGPVDSRRLVPLRGSLHPFARPQFDAGPVDPSMKLDYITLMLHKTDQQQGELDQLLIDQQDPLSPKFHEWLEPEQFADRFGVSPADLSTIQTWLQSQGLSVIQPARGRMWIAFTGTAAQVQNAFQTEIRHYQVEGELHYANSSEPSVPAAIAPLVMGFMGLDDFRPRSSPRVKSAPQFTTTGGAHFLSPDDLATIYNIAPIYKAGINGNGQKLVIAGQTAIHISDMRQFRSAFGLPATDPQVVLVPGSTDPGITGDLDEAALDVEWSGAIARNAQLIYVYSSNVAVSAAYAIDQNLAPVVSFSYGLCEQKASGTTIASAYQSIAQQGNAQGITWLASSGDAGAAACDRQGASPLASSGIAVNLPASVPEVTGVGGTQFAEGNGNYWSSATTATGSSALSYIPEVAWNENGSNGLGSTGGGLSTFYSKPLWQAGLGVPSANARAVPDISLTAAGHDGYLVYLNAQPVPIGGTSASTPAFAGLVTLLNQFTNSKGQGNLNPNLYRLASTTPNVFHDVVGGSNVVPCAAGSPNCSQGSFGYFAGPGYDAVTGWGSVDATGLFNNWTNSLISTAVSLTASPTTVPLSGSTQLTATVRAIGSGGVPTGTVTFLFGRTSLGAVALSNGVATLTVYASQLPTGNDAIIASYSGTPTFGGSSGAVTLSISIPAGTAAVIPSVSPNPVYQQSADADGYSWFYTIRLTDVAGVASTLTGFTINGANFNSQIAGFFGSSSIAPFGTLAASLRTRNLTVPTNVVFGFTGLDSAGHQWTQQITVPFFGQQISASVQLAGLPNVVHQDVTSSDPTCQWFQNLGLQEQNGHGVYLTRFLADGQDLSDQIAAYFGDTYLPAFGSLLGGVCWTINTLPLTISYEVDGIDELGNNIVATLSSQFLGPPPASGGLTTTTQFITQTIANSTLNATTTVGVSLAASQQWTVSVFPSNRTTSWLTVYPQSGTGPATLNISMAGAGLADGLYQATLVFQSNNTLPQSANVYLYFVVGKPNITQVLNAASLVDSGLSPGLIFAIKGTGLGSPIGQNTFLDDNGRITNDISGVEVFVNNVRAPLLYLSAGQINAVVPYEVAKSVGQRVSVQVVNNGVNSNFVTDLVVPTAPAIFPLGGGQGAIRNADNSVNGPGNGAARGSFIAIYGTGEGQTNPPGIDGRIANDSLPNLPRPAAPFSITIGGVTANSVYDGAVPGSFEGFFQVNAQIPNSVPSGPNQVIMTIGGVSSPPLNVVVK
ncbi:MAG TPA: protease pro-enzyme activation domain-containing protein [Bryobacteraceae bacterium]|nr:protease pro-enzyme activation domain-containing protein [Bryobacteraceae bacterium]